MFKNRILRIIFHFLMINILSSCSERNVEPMLQEKVAEYCEVYQQRDDLGKFMEFYDDEIVLKDIINGDVIKGKEKLKSFFDWENQAFEKLDSLSFEVEEKFISDNKAVIKGYFNPFKWGETTFGSMYFVTILTFNDAGLIISQEDWINYPSSLVDFNNRKNANDWIDQN